MVYAGLQARNGRRAYPALPIGDVRVPSSQVDACDNKERIKGGSSLSRRHKVLDHLVSKDPHDNEESPYE